MLSIRYYLSRKELVFYFRFHCSFVFLAEFAFFSVEGAGFPSVILSAAKDLSVLVDLSCYGLDGFGEAVALQFTLPDDDDSPAFGLQLAPCVLVTLLVSGYFCGPEVGVSLGNGVVGAVFVTMPEAPVNEDDRTVLGKDNIWFSGESLVIYAVSKSQMPKGMPQLQLRLGGS